MNFKVISTETIADTRLASLKGKISVLSNGLNIFTGSKAIQIIDDLLATKETGINLRELFSKIEGLEFLAFESKPVVDKTTDERSQMTSAQKSIYTCLDKLSKKNKAKIQEVLARDFQILGFKEMVYKPKEPGWLGEELRKATRDRNILEVQNLLDRGADINAKDPAGWTALIHASWDGTQECVDLLLKAGAKIEEMSNKGRPALMYAADMGKVGCVDILLKAGADFDARGNDGETALDLAKSSYHNEVVKLLEAAMADQPDGPVVNSTNRPVYTPKTPNWLGEELRHAAEEGSVTEIEKLLDSGADINATDNDGCTALMFAAGFGKADCMDLLLKAGTDMNGKCDDGWAALMLAAFYGREECVELLLKAEAKIDEKNCDGNTALDLAKKRNHIEVVKLIESAMEDHTPKESGWLGEELREAAEQGKLSEMQKLIDRGADINAKNNDGWTALMCAASSGKADCVDMLIKAGAKIDEKDTDDWTPLMLATINGKAACVDLLIKAGAKIDEKDNSGRTALDIAKKHNRIKVVRVLEAAMKDQS